MSDQTADWEVEVQMREEQAMLRREAATGERFPVRPTLAADPQAARETLRPDPLTPSREMTPDELVEACERMDVVERAITIPAMWPRLILERERAAAVLRAVTPDPAEPDA